MKKIMLFTVMAMLISGFSAFAGSTEGSLAGVVLDGVTGEPLANAMVCVMVDQDGHGGFNPYVDRTGDDGTFLIENIPAGEWLARAVMHHVGYAEQMVTIEPDTVTTVTFEIAPPETGILSGTVVDAETGEAISGARVSLRSAQESNGGMHAHHSAVTDENGEFVIEGIPAGDYTAKAVKRGYAPASQDVTITADTETVVTFEMEPPQVGSLSGTVIDAETGEAVDHAVVILRKAAEPTENLNQHHGMALRFRTHTDADGAFLLENIPVGDWTVKAFKRQIGSAEEDVVIELDTETVVTLELTPSGTNLN